MSVSGFLLGFCGKMQLLMVFVIQFQFAFFFTKKKACLIRIHLPRHVQEQASERYNMECGRDHAPHLYLRSCGQTSWLLLEEGESGF